MQALRPLEGLHVLDLTHVIAGPYATYLLATLGAEVIRIEPLGGDSLRHRSGSDAALRAAGMGTGFQAQGGNKTSLFLDLNQAEGRAEFLDLLADADVLVDNFRPGVMDRMGLSTPALLARRPDLIHCSLSGYAPEDRRADWPAYDNVIQAASGLMALSGTKDTGPLKSGAPIVDYASGMMMAFSITSALYARAQGAQGGQMLQISMQETAQAMMGSVIADHLATGSQPAAKGNAAGSGMPASGCFETANGTLAIGANEAHQFTALLEVLGISGLMQDPRFADDDARRKHASVLGESLEEALSAHGAEEWEERLNCAGVPAARVRSLPEAVAETRKSGSPFLAGDPGLPTVPLRLNDAAPRLARCPGPVGNDGARFFTRRTAQKGSDR
tara:strand:- start:16751 stop:17914 length:1164 start_codon:yes stop_codon:yes gene_type:complete